MREFKLTDKGYEYLIKAISLWCPLGITHFCDGTQNYSAPTPPRHNVRPCEYFINGRCTEPHIQYCKQKNTEDE